MDHPPSIGFSPITSMSISGPGAGAMKAGPSLASIAEGGVGVFRRFLPPSLKGVGRAQGKPDVGEEDSVVERLQLVKVSHALQANRERRR